MRYRQARFFGTLVFTLVLIGPWHHSTAQGIPITFFGSSVHIVQSERQLPSSQKIASDAVDVFLKGIKLMDLQEGKAMLARTQWITGDADYGENFYSRPVYTNAKTIFETLFDTDILGISGYKRLMEMDAVSETQNTLKLRFIAIAFADKKTGEWKVLGTVLAGSVDIEKNVQYFEQHLSDTRYTSPQDNYLIYGNWLLRAGRITEAKAALIKARTAKPYSDSDPQGIRGGKYAPIHQAQIESLLQAIARIAGI